MWQDNHVEEIEAMDGETQIHSNRNQDFTRTQASQYRQASRIL